MIWRMAEVLDPVVTTGCRLAGNGSQGKTSEWAIYRAKVTVPALVKATTDAGYPSVPRN
jgi:hypothetical protein